MRVVTGPVQYELRKVLRGFPGRLMVPRLRGPGKTGFAGAVKTRFVVVLVTAPNRQTARKLARVALDARLVACANLVPGIESHYWWQGRLERSSEVLILFKTTRPKVPALEKVILAGHPYDTPEFVVLTLDSGSKRYLAWLGASVGPLPMRRSKP